MKSRKTNFFAIAITVLVLCICFAMTAFAAETVSSGAQGTSYSWILDSEGTLTITSTGDTIAIQDNAKAFTTWRKAIEDGQTEANENRVKKLVIGNTATYRVSMQHSNPVFAGYPNLVSIDLNSVTRIDTGYYWTNTIFGNNPKLTTISCANSEKNAEGVVNIEKLSYLNEYGGNTAFNSMFSGCSSITKIVFPETAPTGYNNSSSQSHCNFSNNTFKNCSSLTELTIPGYIDTINANIFDGCSALKSLTVLNGNVSLEGLTLPDNGGMTFTLSSQAQVDFVNANYTDPIVNTIKITGEETGKYAWELFGGVLTFVRPEGVTGTEIRTENNYSFVTWRSTYGSQVKHIVISDEFTSIYASHQYSVVGGFPNLETINLGNITSIGSNYAYKGIFLNDAKLTTVWSNKAEKKDGVVDISYITYISGGCGAATNDGPSRLFEGCSSIKKVILPATVSIQDSKNHKMLANNTFKNCTSLEEVVLPAYCSTISSGAFTGCTSLKSLQIECTTLDIAALKAEIPDNEGMTIYCATQAQYDAVSASFTNAKPAGVLIKGEESGKYTWALDVLSGELIFSTIDGATNKSLSTANSLTALNTWKKTYADQVKKITVGDGFFEVYGGNVSGPLNGFKNVTEINMGNVNQIGSNWNWTGVFQGLEKLTTVYGNKVDRKENVVDISFITYMAGDTNGTGTHDNLFNGCKSVTKVIFPASIPTTNGNKKVDYIGNYWFKGCTALESMVVPGYVLTVMPDAFTGCTGLNTVILTNPETVPTDATVFASNTTVICANADQEAKIKAVSAETKTANYDSLISHGLSIRTGTYNGLRGIFGYNKAIEETLETTYNISLVEYGIITCSEDKHNVFGTALTKKNGEYTTAHSYIQKMPIYKGSELVGSLLSTDVDNNSDTVDFAGAVVKYSNNFKTGVYIGAYAVYTDVNGNEFVTYQDVDGSKINSLYGTTVSMLSDSTEKPLANTPVDVSAVWNTLYQGALELSEGTKVIDLGGNAKMMVAVLDEVNYLMVGAPTKAEAEAAMTAAEAKAAELGVTAQSTVAVAVTDILTSEPVQAAPDPEPINLSDAWMKEVEAQVTQIPEGKSFIFITDTHWSMKNKKDSPELMRYINKLTGIDTVVFGGDMLTSEVSYDAADPNGDAVQKEYIGFWQRGVVDNFGTGSIFVMGNHDGNYLRYTNSSMQSGADADKAPIDILIDDRDIVDNSITHLIQDSYEELDYTVTFDTVGIKTMDDILVESGADATARAQVEAMMKLHYTYDDHNAKIRYIVLDTGGNTYAQTQILNSSYTSLIPVNYRFLEKSLKETPAGYDVVVAAHELSEDGAFTKNNMEAYIYNIISAFKAGISTNISDATKSEWPSIDADTQPLLYAFAATQSGSYDFTENGKFTGKVFTISGHVHDDHDYITNQTGLGKNTGGTYAEVTAEGALSDTAVLAIRTAADCLPEEDRKNLTAPNSQVIDIITITETGVVCTRIGLGESRSFAY